MKALAIAIAFAVAAPLLAVSTVPADAARRHHHHSHGMRSGPGYYEGLYEQRIDRRDRASSPYAGGAGG